MEVWKPVVGFESYYSVSNLGRVRRELAAPGARVGRVLKHVFPAPGYAAVNLSRNGVVTTIHVHILVALAFYGPCPEGKEVNHENGDKRDPRADNLTYTTHQGNAEHAVRTGLIRTGERHHLARLSNAAVLHIHARVAGGASHGDVAREMGISREHARDIVNGKRRRHG